MFGWSYPEAQTATWMNYDTRIQNILQEALKKLIVEACKKLMRNNRLFNGDLHVVHLMTTFLCTEGNGKTPQHVNTAKYELGYHISKFVGKLVRHENRHDREADGAIREIDKLEAETCGPEAWRRYLHCFVWNSHIWKGSSKTRHSLLPEFLQHFMVYSCYPRTQWR